MTTSFRKPVFRESEGTLRHVGAKYRAVVVGLEPGDVISMRFKGCKQRLEISVDSVLHYALRLRAEQLKREKRAAKKARKP